MATNPMSKVLDNLRQAGLRRDEAGLSDGQLLECFVQSREEAAFEALVRRHGPMVLGVCRRILANEHDAEDAFQATFLVLVRKAAGIVPREMLANWLYGVACKTAYKARALAARRWQRERQVSPMPEPPAMHQQVGDELPRLLDQELSRLPDKYRIPLVLCLLQGKTYEQAAGQMGVSAGTVSVRLVRARAMLARRLARRGVAVSAGSLAVVVSQSTASAAVPPALLADTVRAASLWAFGQTTGLISAPVAALTQGVLKAMLLTRLKMAATVLLVIAAGAGAGVLIYHGQAAQPPNGGLEVEARAPEQPQRQGDYKVMKELADLQGTWTLTSWQQNGRPEIKANKDGRPITDGRLKIEGDKLTFSPPGAGGKAIWAGRINIDPAQQPKAMDWKEMVRLEDNRPDGDLIGIYELKGDTLTFCYGNKRPPELKTRPDRDLDERMFVFKREKP
jgi:RNA polymerase sigma-70 factor (ECF subfamily)